MLRERLLERISRLEQGGGSAEGGDGSSPEVQSIILHLGRLLNTRQGSVLIAHDYGVPDMTNVPGDSIQEIRHNVEEIIQGVVRKYEPRLDRVRLRMEHEDRQSFALRFRLEAVLAENPDVTLTFETVVTTDGHIGISQ